MATGGLYGASPNGNVVASSGSESSGLYGNSSLFGGTYFEYLIFIESATIPATPTGGSWSFTTNIGTPPTGWTNSPPASPTNPVYLSIALVNSRGNGTLTWSVPGQIFKQGPTGPTGATGATGPQGPQGNPGTAATIAAGTTTTGAAGTSAAVVNSGTSSAAVFNFTIPKGDTGATGPTGSTGSPGAAATVAAGTTTTGAAGTSASVINSGTSSAAVFNFTIPRGDVGATGATGSAATVAAGTTTTGAAGTSASVTNSGTSSAAVFNFTIPRGDTGATGAGVPVGGTAGQALTKIDSTNYNTQWHSYGTMADQNANSVAITGGLISNTTLSGATIDNSAPYLTFSNGAGTTLASGRMWYDGSTGSWNLGMGNGNITQQVGEELFVYGKASAAITDSPLQIIYQTGTVGASGVVTFAPTISGITNGDLIVGVSTESIALNGFGRVNAWGIVHGITTNGAAYGETWADNDTIWYNPVTGNPTNVKPVAPNIKVSIGTVIKAGSGGSGTFSVEISHGSVLGGTDSNVQLTSVANNNLLQYDSTAGYWKNVATISNSNLTYSSITINGSAISLGGTVSVGTVTSVAGAGTVNGLTLTGTVTTSGSLTLSGTLNLSSPPVIGNTTPAAITGTTITGTTFVGISGGTF